MSETVKLTEADDDSRAGIYDFCADRKARCGICGGSGESRFRGDASFVQEQALRRAMLESRP